MLQELLLHAFKNKDYSIEINKLLGRYSKDFDRQTLETELEVLSSLGIDTEQGFLSLRLFFGKRESRIRFPAATRLFQLILVLPATNAISERSFSKLKTLKSSLRSTMGDNRLTNLMMCYIHSDITLSLNLTEIANIFVADVDNRKHAFGKCSPLDFA